MKRAAKNFIAQRPVAKSLRVFNTAAILLATSKPVYGGTIKSNASARVKSGQNLAATRLDSKMSAGDLPSQAIRTLPTTPVKSFESDKAGKIPKSPTAPVIGTSAKKTAKAQLLSPPAPKALTGRQMLQQLSALSPEQREARIESAMISGNVPITSKHFRDVTISGRDLKGKPHVLTLRVMPDYAAVGTDQDPFRIPMQPQTAQRIADFMGYMLPTRKLVDAIYRESTIALKPFYLQASQSMVKLNAFWRHNEIIEDQLSGKQKGLLVAGHKKDIVVSAGLRKQPDHMAIYGWHNINGDPIQPLSLVHKDNYVDYSHGIRFISRLAILDNMIVDLNTLMRDRNLSPLVSDEGPVLNPGYGSEWASVTNMRK